MLKKMVDREGVEPPDTGIFSPRCDQTSMMRMGAYRLESAYLRAPVSSPGVPKIPNACRYDSVSAR